MKCTLAQVLLGAAIFSGAPVFGATLTVLNTDDSGAGSLRQAITDANGMAGADTILFDIPGAGQKTITLLSLLPVITETVTIDGGNGGVASSRVQLTGAGVLATGLDLEGAGVSGSALRNLIINGFTSRQILLSTVSDSMIQNCFIGLNTAGTAVVAGSATGIESCCGSSGNLIGGASADERNVITGASSSAVSIDAGSAIIQGNFIGLSASGLARVGSSSFGVLISNASGTIGGTNPGEGNVIVATTGVEFSGNPALGKSSGTVQGNLIGTDVNGSTALNFGGGVGVEVSHASGVVINGGNVISGNGTGVSIHSSGVSGATSDSTTVQGNFIGTAADGVTALGNGGAGVDMFLTPNNTIGGTNDGEGNIIAFNGGVGVRNQLGTGNRIERNSIFSNVGLGIDQSTGGVTLNDFGDVDDAQNFPRITSVTQTSTDVMISGILSSRVNMSYRLEFFGNDEADPSGFGEGQTFLGSTDVMTDGAGGAALAVSFPASSSFKSFTATATSFLGESSEFSHAYGTKLQNISTRLNVLTDDNVLIGGFIVTGNGPKQVIVRAIGPSLGSAGLSGVLADPVLQVVGDDGTTMTNDNWKDSQQAEIEATGIPPSDELESAIVATFEPGAYTAIVSGKNGGTGVGLIEAYDLDQFLGPILANISTRGFVAGGDDAMIGGFIVGPSDSGLTKVLVRGIGPSLSSAGIANPLLDPILELRDGNGVLLATNDNWKDTQQSEIQSSGIPPSDDSESAISQSLAPGAYTAILRGVNDTTGVGLVEVYNLANTL